MHTQPLLVLTTVPAASHAETIARKLVEERCAACVTIGAPVRSLYHWRGKTETAEAVWIGLRPARNVRRLIRLRDAPGARLRAALAICLLVAVATVTSATAAGPVASRTIAAPAGAGQPTSTPSSSDDLLDPEIAFKASATLVGRDRIEIRYDTAPGYYLYRDRLRFTLAPAAAHLGRPKLPKGKVKNDEFFGRQVIYRNRSVVTIPIQWSGTGPLTLTADLQGCADLGVCYPPVRRTFTLAP